MKIGIISVNNAHNFGTSMQAYALTQRLQSLGHTVQVINYRNRKIEGSYSIAQKPPKKIKAIAIYGAKYAAKVIRKPYLITRRRRYEGFFSNYFNLTAPANNYKQLCMSDYGFDVAFAGSDQIWNANIVSTIDPAFFLKFLDGKTICASYAASLGVEEISEQEKEVYCEFLKHLDYISVREESARQLLSPLTDNTIEVIADPTVLLRAEDYKKLVLSRPYEKEYIYVHVHHYTAKSPELIELAEKVSKQTGLPVIHNFQHYTFSNQAGTTCDAGPIETLSALYHAKYVLTQSFHITMFSLIFHKQFVTVKRDRYNTRLENLLGSVNMLGRLVEPGTKPDLDSLPQDYEAVDQFFARERQKAEQFIERVISGQKRDPIPNFFLSQDPFTCYGCSACRDVCPVQAIEMKQDEEGFVRPFIHQDKCIHCGKCEKSCIWGKEDKKIPDEERRGYYALAKDRDVHINSSSGGVATVLGQYFIEQGGYVTGVKWSSASEAEYDITDSLEGIEAFKYSKYIEPKHGDIYRKTKDSLLTGKPVLFIGSPCKVAGLKAYLGKEYDNLFTTELICECSPSPLILPIHLRKKSGEARSPVSSVRFREPEGWQERNTGYRFENGKTDVVHYKSDWYFQCFIKQFLAKKACYRCEFTKKKTGSDMVIGDFWGINKRFPFRNFSKGVSCLIVNTEKGRELLKRIGDRLETKPVPVGFILQNNASWPSVYNTKRVTLINDILNEPEKAEILLRRALRKNNTGSVKK